MLIYYSGSGCWYKEIENKPGSTAWEPIKYVSFCSGLFKLPEINQKEINYTGKTKVSKLLPSSHLDAVKAPLAGDYHCAPSFKKVVVSEKDKLFFLLNLKDELDENSPRQEYSVSKEDIINDPNNQNFQVVTAKQNKKTSPTDLKRLNCLKWLITDWEYKHKVTFETDVKYGKTSRKIIPISSNTILKALNKEFKCRNIRRLKASKLESTSFWKVSERKDICVLITTNSRDKILENKIISNL